MKNYIDLVYSEKLRPVTDFPFYLAEYFVKRLNLKGSILDVGAGRGEYIKAFKDLGLDAKAVDVCKTDSTFLEDEDIEVKIMEKGATLPYPDNSFDIVFSKSVIEHLWDSEFHMSECHRILKPGGQFICLTPDWQTQMKIFYSDHTHKKPYTKLGLKMSFLQAGFKDITSEVFYQLPSVWKYPILKTIFKPFQHFPVKKVSKIKYIRFSRELMILALGKKS